MTNDETLRIVENFLNCMPKTYRARTVNWGVVQHLIFRGTFTEGATSCIELCRTIGIDPFGHTLERAKEATE